MASGKLGKAALLAAQWTLLYTVPVGTEAAFNFNIVNTGTSQIKVSVAIVDADQSSITVADYIEYEQVLPPSGVLERTGVVCGSGEKLYVYSDSAGGAVRVHGFEEVL